MTLVVMVLLIGLAHVVAGVLLAALPGWTREKAVRFPRNAWLGRILAAVTMAWSVHLVREMPLGWFDAYKMWLWVAGPVAYLLVVFFVEELLAARALGGLLLLIPCPLLDAARFQESAWRLAPVILAYVWVICGMALVLAPYRFREWVQLLGRTDGRCRVMGVLFLAAGLLFAWLSFRGFGAAA